MLAYRKSFSINGNVVTVIVAQDMHALASSQASLHTWTAVVSLLLIALLVAVIWVGITISLRPVTSLKTELKSLQSGALTRISTRSEEHTSELQSRPHLVCRLLLEKKN